MSRRVAYCLFNYFPYGGLQRDFLRIAMESAKRGIHIDVYTMKWEGEVPDFLHLHLMSSSGFSNHQQVLNFIAQVSPCLEQGKYDCVVGFNKMPHLDIYYAADPCYQALAWEKHGFLYRCMRRYRTYVNLESSVFSPPSKTQILLISPLEKAKFQHCYHTPDSRLHLIPPPLSRDRCPPPDRQAARNKLRQELHIDPDEKLVLFVASAFKTKGLDRVMMAMRHLPDDLRHMTTLVVVGRDDPKPYLRYALDNKIKFLGARDDIPALMVAADCLIHPARTENTGTVLLEALLCGLPVITTGNCGFAFHVRAAKAGIVLSGKFNQRQLNEALAKLLMSSELAVMQQQALAYTASLDLFNMPSIVNDMIEKYSRIL